MIMWCRMRSRRGDGASADRYGFTLIELLVVVAIIALLISILLPSLSRARAQAKSVVCLTNLKQQGLAAMMYGHENRDILPTTNDDDTIEGIDLYFARQIDRMVSRGHKEFYCPVNDLRPWVPDDF